LAATGEGLAALHGASALVEETGERYVEAQIHRLEGHLLLADNGSAEAEPCCVKALEAARSLELRAACNLARLCGEQGRSSEARGLLAPIYGWFTRASTRPTSKRRRRCSTNSTCRSR
jgi:predicted ATPase